MLDTSISSTSGPSSPSTAHDGDFSPACYDLGRVGPNGASGGDEGYYHTEEARQQEPRLSLAEAEKQTAILPCLLSNEPVNVMYYH